MRELDAERIARQQSERTAEGLRGELVAARSEARDAAVVQAVVRARLEAQAAALADRLAAAEQAQRKAAHDLDVVQVELGAAQRRAERAEAEAALAPQLLAELRMAPPERDGGGRRRKAGSPASTGQAAPGEKQDQQLDEQQDDKQGAPAAALNPEDGSDSSDDSNDSTDDRSNERAAAIRWIQAEMVDYGLTMEELAAAGCFEWPPPPPPPLAPAPPPVVSYRNAAGQSWNGQGEMPDWLRRAANAGQSVEFFRVG